MACAKRTFYVGSGSLAVAIQKDPLDLGIDRGGIGSIDVFGNVELVAVGIHVMPLASSLRTVLIRHRAVSTECTVLRRTGKIP
jgi:hypothetical protein